MKKKRMLALLLTVAMAGTMLAGCGRSDGKEDEKGKNQAKSEGKVYYLNFKPEQADDWVKLAETYTDETGVQVDVQTAASGTYESQLKSEMAKEEAPTLFQVNGPVGLASWKDYCYDLSDSQIYKDISSDDYVLKEGDEVNRACEKRPVPLAELERAADEIEQAIQNSLDREISTEKIGELVMERLKPLDEVAYVRFASVYRQFKDIDSFMRELNKILEER